MDCARLGTSYTFKYRFYGGRSSVGRAPGCDPGCRGFEPHRSPQFLLSFVGWISKA